MDDDKRNLKQWRKLSRLRVDKTSVRKRARKIETATLKHANRFLTRRWTNVREVGRSTVGWLLLVALLIGLTFFQSYWRQSAYSVIAPQDGSTYAEGMVGKLETMNPLFATTAGEVSASKLLFSGLLRYDQDNQLLPDAAKSLTISEDSKVYDVVLRDDIMWHDGEKLTADDVLFTIRLIQNQATRAEQYGSWVGVKAEKTGEHSLKLTLPSVYAPFAHFLTFGILPQHILASVAPAELRENPFGRRPIGSGPFVFKRFQIINPAKSRMVVHMEANADYYHGAPRLNRFQIHTYEDSNALRVAFTTSEINAAMGMSSSEINQTIKDNLSFVASETTISNGMYALFNNDSPLMKEAELRKALVAATDRKALKTALHGRAVNLEGPLLSTQVGSNTLKQSKFDSAVAAEKLDALGWKLEGKTRKKDGQALTVNLVAPDVGDYKVIINELKKQWEAVGVTVKATLAKPQNIATQYLQPRNYDVLVYELAIGADPDVSFYWSSAQAASGPNFANYRSGLADDALSSAKGRLQLDLRQAKYRAFAEQWIKDAPAIALYQPMFSYVTTDSSSALTTTLPVADATARYRNVLRWAVNSGPVFQTP